MTTKQANARPTTTVREPELVGIDTLTQAQFDAVSKALNHPRSAALNSTFVQMHRGSIQNMLGSLHGDEVEFLAKRDPAAFTQLAVAFGHKNPEKLTHVGRVELEATLQKKIASLAI